MPKISIIHPSRSRPDQCAATVRKWMELADCPGRIEWLVSLDTTDNKLRQYSEQLPINVTVLRNNNRSAIQAINHAATHATANIMLVCSDDTDTFQSWDTALLSALGGKEDFVAKVHDGIQDFIITMPVCDRVWYSRLGYIYHPGYSHLWPDGELACVAWMMGKYIKIDLTFPHLHYSKGLSKKDAINIKNDATWRQGETLFYKRKAANFGLKSEDIVQPFPSFAGFK